MTESITAALTIDWDEPGLGWFELEMPEGFSVGEVDYDRLERDRDYVIWPFHDLVVVRLALYEPGDIFNTDFPVRIVLPQDWRNVGEDYRMAVRALLGENLASRLYPEHPDAPRSMALEVDSVTLGGIASGLRRDISLEMKRN